MQFGRKLLNTNQTYPSRVSFDGSPIYKGGGITIATSTLTAASGSDTTLPDGSIIKAGVQFLRYGQVMTKITTATQQTLTGTATAGAFTLTIQRPDTGAIVKTASIAFNASAATVLAAIQAVMGPGQALSSSGGALGTAAVTIVFGSFVPLMVVTDSTLTGGTMTPAVTVAGTNANMFGPYDSAASDGRQTLTRGACYILDSTWVYNPTGSVGPEGLENIGQCIEGGRVLIDSVLHAGTGTASLAAGPQLAALLTAMPAILPQYN